MATLKMHFSPSYTSIRTLRSFLSKNWLTKCQIQSNLTVLFFQTLFFRALRTKLPKYAKMAPMSISWRFYQTASKKRLKHKNFLAWLIKSAGWWETKIICVLSASSTNVLCASKSVLSARLLPVSSVECDQKSLWTRSRMNIKKNHSQIARIKAVRVVNGPEPLKKAMQNKQKSRII